jgi:hypothetical protein
MSNIPSWLKAGQNGSIGEIRTKSFLIDRFWVLERSVDIHGADFIIQRRLYEKNILDDQPTRFGVVQAKFSQDIRTNHAINKEYILDKENNPRREFFLIIHSGDEEDRRMFLLTSEDIIKNFPLSKNNVFSILSSKIFSTSKYQITNRKLALDRIENSIQCADFYKNRLYVFKTISSEAPDFEAILPDYKENIEHWFGYVHEVFSEKKEKAFYFLLQIEKLHNLYINFIESIDPLEACIVAEKIYYEFGDSISLVEIFNKDFYYGAKNHKEMIETMRNDSALDNYISAKKLIIDEINIFLQTLSKDNIDSDTIHKITINYNPDNLKFISLSNQLSHVATNATYNEFSKFLSAKEGYIVFEWKLGRQCVNSSRINMNECCVNEIMEKIYALKYYEDHEYNKQHALNN